MASQHPVKIRVEVQLSPGNVIFIEGDEVTFPQVAVRPRHVKLAAEIGQHVKEIIAVVENYRKNVRNYEDP
jgi:hypothetical protein